MTDELHSENFKEVLSYLSDLKEREKFDIRKRVNFDGKYKISLPQINHLLEEFGLTKDYDQIELLSPNFIAQILMFFQ